MLIRHLGWTPDSLSFANTGRLYCRSGLKNATVEPCRCELGKQRTVTEACCQTTARLMATGASDPNSSSAWVVLGWTGASLLAESVTVITAKREGLRHFSSVRKLVAAWAEPAAIS